MIDDGIVIQPITDVAGLREVELVQSAVWGMPDRDLVPLHQLLAASGAGGAVLGAFASDGRLAGFCYGFAGWRQRRPLFYSHMAGVLPEFRGRGIGFQLKRAQREAALARGFEHMVWTYDPLQNANAYLNLHKLGAEVRRYYVNYYGEMADALNRGTESDRLEVDWWLRDRRVAVLMRGEAAPMTLDEAVRLEIPSDITSLRRIDPEAASAWRLNTRQQFLRYFEQGYMAVDFERGADRSAYVLVHRPGRTG